MSMSAYTKSMKIVNLMIHLKEPEKQEKYKRSGKELMK